MKSVVHLTLGLCLLAWPAAAQDENEETKAEKPVRRPLNGAAPAPAEETAAPPLKAAETETREAEHMELASESEPEQRRLKPLQVTVGAPPTAQDLGSEADIVQVRGDEEAVSRSLERWTLKMKGNLRAPMRVGIGPRNDGTDGYELHAPPRMVGLSSGTWEYLSLAPNPSFSMYFTYGNPLVSANVIWSSSYQYEAGYRSLDQIGGLSQAYLALKFPDVFGKYGGLAWTVGAFSNRYGLAGPRGTSTGYYGTYLFGRTHVMGEVLTANVDLTDRIELVVEHGFGAKLDVIPYITESPERPGGAPENDFFPGQGPVPVGSNYVHHAHAGLYLDDWLKFTGHYMTSWSPNDNSFGRGTPAEEARLTTFGGDVRVDSEAWGNGYLGYSHARGDNLMPLGDGIQVLHGSTGRGFKENYFGRKNRVTNVTPTNSSGDVDTVLFQYLFRLSGIWEKPLGARDASIALYSMFNHAVSPPEGQGAFAEDIDIYKLKFGGELQLALLRFMSAGVRVDRVIPDLADDDSAYTAISPRLLFYSRLKSKEYILVNYTRFLLGPEAYPSSPYSDLTKADPHMIMLAAVMSFGP
jgi:hypothetical protein